jgi:hypothetical protein
MNSSHIFDDLFWCWTWTQVPSAGVKSWRFHRHEFGTNDFERIGLILVKLAWRLPRAERRRRMIKIREYANGKRWWKRYLMYR